MSSSVGQIIGAATLGLMGGDMLNQAYQANKANQQMRSAQRQALAQAEATAKSADEATNRANQKSPDVVGALTAAMQSGKAGASGTMLTGAQGVDASGLQLGRSTLLGG